MTNITQLLEKDSFSKEEIIQLLSVTGEEKTQLFIKASEIKEKYIGRKVYFRGLIEMSNICSKNCFYCGIRAGNNEVKRYTLTDDEVIDAAKFAWENKYGSIALQTGEVSTKEYVDRIENLLEKINAATNNELGITLSLGEQTEETYRNIIYQ